MTKLPVEHQDLKGLRNQDLIAKVAKVNLHATMRVLLALDLIAAFLQTTPEDVLRGFKKDATDRAGGDDIEVCDRAFAKLLAATRDSGVGDAVFHIRKIGR